MSDRKPPEIHVRLHPKQGVAFQTPATEVLFGGAAGAGKSGLMRIAAVAWSSAISGLQVYLFRRLRDDLVKNHVEGPGGFRVLLAPWVESGHCTIVEDEIRFWNGSKIYLCHCKDEKDRFKYQGSEIHVLLIDELTHFTDVIYRFLRSRVRMAGITIPSQFEGMFPRILCGSNPGNIGHAFVRSTFIDPREPMKIERMPSSEGGMLRQYIPGKLSDNPSIDPAEYAGKLQGLGNPALVKAMLDGDWSVVSGAFFPEFDIDKHVLKARALPAYWHRFRSFDWGSARPFSVGWWAVSDGELFDIPRGALVRYREWYGAQRDAAGAVIPNQGLRMTVEEVADGILEREKSDVYANRVMSGVADPAIFAQNGGPSMADRMIARRCFFRPADNTRVARNGAAGGWDQVRARLKGEDGKPMMYVFDTCREFIRTFPALQHDEANPEDLNSDGEDHIADECFIAGTLILTARGQVPIEQVHVGDMVKTRFGYREVTATFTNGVKDVLGVGLSDGSTLFGTGNHPIWVNEQAFISLSDLRDGDKLLQCKSLLSAPQSKNSTAFATTFAAGISSAKACASIAWFGATLTAQSLMDMMCTTRIATDPTTRPATWTASLNPIMAGSMEGSLQRAGSSICRLPMPLRRNGTLLRPELSGTDSIMSAIAGAKCIPERSASATNVASNSLPMEAETASAPMPASLHGDERKEPITSSAPALAAQLSSPQTVMQSNGSARWFAPLRRLTSALNVMRRAVSAAARSKRLGQTQNGALFVVGKPQHAGRAKVYNLSVDGAEEYFANGVLVHNCRYALLSRPYTAPLPVAASEDERDGYARRWKAGRKQRGSVMTA